MALMDIRQHPVFEQVEWPINVELVETIRKGIEYQMLSLLNVHYGFSLEQWAVILQVSDRTLLRYEKESKPFGPIQSEKLLKLCLLLKLAWRNFRDIYSFRTWLALPNTALGEVAPISLLDTFSGTEMVISVLIRAEYGILS
jgi:putative toxin-antitoxin system antitoxin component (TIGR02293 family)